MVGRLPKMPPAGYPAFLQYLQSGRVSRVSGSRTRTSRSSSAVTEISLLWLLTCSFPPRPRRAAGSDRFWLLELRVSRTFLDQLRPQLFRPLTPNSMRCKDLRHRSDRFWLRELRVSQHFSTFY